MPRLTWTTTMASGPFGHSVLPSSTAYHQATLLLLHQSRVWPPKEGGGVGALTMVPLRFHWSHPQAPAVPLLARPILAWCLVWNPSLPLGGRLGRCAPCHPLPKGPLDPHGSQQHPCRCCTCMTSAEEQGRICTLQDHMAPSYRRWGQTLDVWPH